MADEVLLEAGWTQAEVDTLWVSTRRSPCHNLVPRDVAERLLVVAGERCAWADKGAACGAYSGSGEGTR